MNSDIDRQFMLETETSAFELRRWPLVPNNSLKAWDAADEYLLTFTASLQDQKPRLLIVNDAHGALSTVLHGLQPVSWSDSYLSHQSARQNRLLNNIEQPLTALESIDSPTGLFDLVLIKVPKTTALLEEQLIALRAHLHDNTRVVAAGMVKHLQKSAFASFEKILGPVTTSLAVKKARLLHVALDKTLPRMDSPFPVTYCDPDVSYSLTNHANVFSREKLDHGARFFLTQFDKLPKSEHAIDLACGNGVLGIRLQQLQPTTRMTFVDESYGAVESARINHAAAFVSGPATGESPGTTAAKLCHPYALFDVADGLEHQAAESADLIVCNPPFHQLHEVGGRQAVGLFKDSKRGLGKKGQLWIVANRHLNHAAVLKRLFGNCQSVASNQKFVVLRVVKR